MCVYVCDYKQGFISGHSSSLIQLWWSKYYCTQQYYTDPWFWFLILIQNFWHYIWINLFLLLLLAEPFPTSTRGSIYISMVTTEKEISTYVLLTFLQRKMILFIFTVRNLERSQAWWTLSEKPKVNFTCASSVLRAGINRYLKRCINIYIYIYIYI